MNNNPLIVYFGHHKCATTWISGIIRETCCRIGWQFVQVDSKNKFDKYLTTGLPPGYILHLPVYVCRFMSFINRNDDRVFVAYTNAKFDYARKLDNFKGFHIIRDPRGILVSAYFSHLYSHPIEGDPEFMRIRDRLTKVSKDEGLLIHMKHRWLKREFEDLYNWDYCQPNVLELKMEDLIQTPNDILMKVFAFVEIVGETKFTIISRIINSFLIGINKINGETRGLFPFYHNMKTVPRNKLLDIIYRNRFSAKTKGRNEGIEDVGHHYRKGISGDWTNHFKSEHKKVFKENYNEVLLKLGYEKTRDW